MTTSTDSAFQVGDRVVCIDDSGAGILHNGREYTVRGISEDYPTVSVEGVEGSHFTRRFRRAPIQPPASDGAEELVVGAEYEGLGSTASKVSDQWFRGKYLGPFISLDGHSRLQERDALVRVVQTASLKRIPDAGEGKAETKPCCRCGASVTRASNAADPGEMPTCRPCKAGVNKPTRKPKTDPYATGYPEVEIAAMQADRDAKRERRKRFTADQLNRPLSTVQTAKYPRSLHPGLVFGPLGTQQGARRAELSRLKDGHPAAWPSQEFEEP